MNLGPTELLIVLVIVMLLFGASRLPKLARSMGEASREFKQGVTESGTAGATSAARADEQVTLTRAELDAMVEREADARRRPPSA